MLKRGSDAELFFTGNAFFNFKEVQNVLDKESEENTVYNLDESESSTLTIPPVIPTAIPKGLELLVHANAIFLKPYAGPHMIGNMSNTPTYEVIDGSGNRIYMISSIQSRKSFRSSITGEDEPKFPNQLRVQDPFGNEVYRYYGDIGEIMKAGQHQSVTWGSVTRKHPKPRLFSCDWLTKIHYAVVIHNHNCLNLKSRLESAYIILGHKRRTIFPTEATKKLYFGSFECEFFYFSSDKTVPMGEISSSMLFEKTGTSYPGIKFNNPNLNVFHKAVLIGSLLIDISKL